MTAPFAAILLAGGRATRLGGTAKPLLEIGGRSLLDSALDAVRAVGAAPVTVVGPTLQETPDVRWVQEDPPFTGPAAAIVAALAIDAEAGTEAEPEWTFVLACDLPRAAEVVQLLARDLPLLPADADGLCLADSTSRPQWLTGVYRTRSLRRGALAVPDHARHAPVRALLDDLAVTVVVAPDALTHDVDTWQDLEQVRQAAAAHPDAGGATSPPADLE